MPSTTPRVAIEFPNYPLQALPELGAQWEDRSWRNEQCPMFLHDGLGLFLFCDYPDAEMREFPDSERFSLHQSAERDPQAGWQSTSEILFVHEEWHFVRDLLDDIASGTDPESAARNARLRCGQTTVADARWFLESEGPDMDSDFCAAMHAVIAKGGN